MRVTTKGQVTIPKQIRDHLGIVPGSEVEFVRNSDGVKLVTVEGGLTREEEMVRFEKALDRMAGTIDPASLMDMDGKEYVNWLRGLRENLDLD